ncbi:hypothetical protein M3J09_008482 [Ascochyta lentis]
MAASNTQPSSHASRSAITNSNACSKPRRRHQTRMDRNF